MTQATVNIAVAGATGYAGHELLRLAARHPGIHISCATSSDTSDTPRRLPRLTGVWNGGLAPFSIDALASEAEAVFLALPDSVASTVAPALLDRGVRVFDLSGAFRLRDPELRKRWYPETTPTPIAGSVYG